MSPVGDWLTVKEAAELSGYNLEHIRRLIRAGEIQAQKWGNLSWMVNKPSLLEYIERAKKSEDKRFGPKL